MSVIPKGGRHDHELAHASGDDRARSDAPGRSSASAALHAHDAPVASGIVMRKANGGELDATAPDAIASASASTGASLPNDLRALFESSLGTDLSAVRLHAGAASQRAASSIGARAYTVGNDIHFGNGELDASSQAGRHLIAHEVAHTVQQRGGSVRPQAKLAVSSPGDGFEVEADRAADAMISGAPVSLGGADVGIARKPTEQNPYAPPAEPEAPAPSDQEREAARKYYTELRDANLAAIKSLDTKLAAIPEHAPNQSSVFGPQVDAETRKQERERLEAMKTDLQAGNETIAGNLVLLDDKDPQNQAKSVNRANASKATYSASEPLNAVQVLLTGAGKSSKTTIVEQKTAHGVGTTTTQKETTGISKDGLEQGTSKTVAVTEGGKTKSVTDSEKLVVGPGGIAKTKDHTQVDDGKLTKTSTTKKLTTKDGRAGAEGGITYSKGSDKDGELGKGATVGATGGAGVTLTDGAAGIDAGATGTAGGQRDAQNKASVTAALNGAATLAITSDGAGNYTATITFTLSGSVGLSGAVGKESQEKATAGASPSGEVRASRKRVISVPLAASDVEAYQVEFQKAAGGTASSKPGLHYVQLLATRGDAALLAALPDGAEDARKQGLGFEQTDSTGYTLGGGGTVSAPGGGTTVGGTLKYGKDKRVRFGHRPKPGDPETLIVVFEAAEDTTIAGGPTVASGAATGGVAYTKKSGGGGYVEFEMPNRADLVAKLAEIETIEDARAFASANGTKHLADGTRVGDGDGIATTVGVGPVSGTLSRGGESGETVVRNADGSIKHVDVYGRNTVEGSATAGPIALGSRKDEDELVGRVTPDGDADLDLNQRTTTKEPSAAELKKNLSESPVTTLLQLGMGSSTPYMKTTTDTKAATKLTEKDLEIVQALAENDDDSKWAKAVGGDGKALDDWYATRQKIRDAKGDKIKIAKALTEFQDSWDAGRGDTIRGLGVGRFHAAWPHDLAGERATFERLASEDLVPSIAESVRTQGADAAIAQIDRERAEIQRLLGVLGTHSDKFEDASMFGEMNKVLGKRSAELQYLKTEIPKRMREAHNAQRQDLIEKQLAHGVDTQNKQTKHIPEVLRPEECIDEETLYRDPGAPQTEPVLSPEEAEKEKRAQVMAALEPGLKFCGNLRKTEFEALTWVESELAKKGNWLDKPDYGKIFTKLNEVRSTWPGWEDVVKRMKSALADAGITATGIDDQGPRKAWLQQLDAEAKSHHG